MLPLFTCLVAAFPLSVSQKSAAAEEFDALLRNYASAGWSGAALVARGDEVLWAQGYGFADFAAGRVNKEDTLFEIASITKPFTATAVVRLAQQKKLSLDESIGVHLPGVPAHSRKITLRHLLAHTSGIPGRNASGRGEDLALAVRDYLGTGPQSDPGTKWEYWNGGYALLAGVIERVSGKSYQQFLEEELFAPAGMSASGFTGDADLDATRAALGSARDGRDRSALEHPYGEYGYQYRGMGGLVTSVTDLHRFDRALADGRLLDSAHRAELFEPVENGYALGWFVGRASTGKPRQSHGGSVRGFVAEFRRFPEADACLAVLCNSDDAKPYEIADNLECLLFGRALKSPPLARPLLSDEDGAALEGVYVGTEGRIVVRVASGVAMIGVEGQALLEGFGASGELSWKPDYEALSRRAVEIVEAIARGNTEPLRTHMAKRIPASWPDTVRRSIWPAHVAAHGEFRGLRPIGATARNARVEVLLALDHATEPARALVAFGPAGLELLDWKGPQFSAFGRLELVRKDVFRVQLGEKPEKLEFEREGGRAVKLSVAGASLERN